MGEFESTAGQRASVSKINPNPYEATLYVCQDCGNGFTDLLNTTECPDCSGSLKHTTPSHE